MRLLEGVRVLDLTNVLAGPFCCYQGNMRFIDRQRVEAIRFLEAVIVGLGFYGYEYALDAVRRHVTALASTDAHRAEGCEHAS